MSTESKSTSSSRPPATGTWRYQWLLLLAAVAVVGAGGAAILWGREHGPKAGHHEVASAEGPSHEQESDSAGTVRVEVVRPERGGLTRTSTQIGSVHPFQYADLYAKVSGYLKWQEVDIGSKVKEGDLLAVIDDPEVIKEAEFAEAALKQSKAVVVQAKARIATAKANVKAGDAAVEKAQAQVGSCVSRRKYREKELQRYKDLHARGAVPQQVVDEYLDHFETAEAEERAAEAEVLSSRAQLESMKAMLDQANADLAEAETNVEVKTALRDKARVWVDYTQIKSPYTGVITLRSFFVGDFVRSAADGNEKPLLTSSRTDKMRVVTYVPDRDVPYTDVGDKAVVTLDALPGMKFEGKVSRFSNSEEAQSRTMRTEIDLDNSKGLLRDGMYGIATIYLEKDTSSLTIPSGCLNGKTENGKSSVYVVRSGRAHEVPVNVGTDNGIRVEILKGLGPDDQVITTKGSVSEDAPVTVEEAPKGHSA